ncbi:MAG: acyl-CoA dehydrogenase family protein [Candidatus Omnitrophica bacterium]|nr:acyl-CoA dehydrogenase family protein [Candidatus Omnitrophota bacterium]
MSIFDKNISKEERESLEFAEDQRETQWVHPSFALQLFHGAVDWGLIHPFPEQSAEDKQIGDNYVGQLRDFLEKNLDPDEVDRTGIIPEKVYQGLAQLKAFAIKVPTEYGGLGMSQVNYNRAIHLVASYCGSTAVLLSAHQSIGVPQPLKIFGTDEQKKKYLPMFGQGTVSAFALTEPEAGSDPRNMTTTATPTEDGQHFLINGDKLWCTNGLIAGVIVVMAVTPPKIIKGKERKQISAFIVEMDTPGIEKVHRCQFLGLHGIQNGLLRFTDVKVPRENIIGAEGDGLKLALTTLNTGRLTLPAASVGIAKWCLHVVREWSAKRVQWGSPIGEHESVGLKLGYIAGHTFAMDALTWLCSHMGDDKKKDIRLEAAMAKYFCTHHAWHIADETLQIRGGQGYESADSLRARGMEPWPVERVLRDCRINIIIEGTSEIMHLFIAREALDPHLSKALPLLSPKTPLGGKLKALGGLIGHYAVWYPKLYLPSAASFGELDERLRPHMHYCQRASKRLARTMFHNMAKYQQKLASKQSILNRFVDIGVELFAMAATCAYADQLAKSKQGKENAIDLADLYCRSARHYIERQFSDGRKNNDQGALKVSKKVLAKDYVWLENDIIV